MAQYLQLLGGQRLQGKSAYDIAVEHGFEGTEEEWLLSIGLPTVTTDNNGDFLRVVDGAWAAVAVGTAEETSF